MNKIYSENIVAKCNNEKDWKIDLPINQPIVFEIGKHKKFRITIQRNTLEIMETDGRRLSVIPESGNVVRIDNII